MAEHKPIIETIINTSAIALSAFGTNLLITDGGQILRGVTLVVLAAALEFFKYYGRKKGYW